MEAQFGFRPSYSTTDTCFTLYLFINRIKKKYKLYCAFIDFSTAFDSINSHAIFQINGLWNKFEDVKDDYCTVY